MGSDGFLFYHAPSEIMAFLFLFFIFGVPYSHMGMTTKLICMYNMYTICIIIVLTFCPCPFTDRLVIN